MVFLFNKAKIFSYVVAVTTVIVLFVVAANLTTEDFALQASTTQIKEKVRKYCKHGRLNKFL